MRDMNIYSFFSLHSSQRCNSVKLWWKKLNWMSEKKFASVNRETFRIFCYCNCYSTFTARDLLLLLAVEANEWEFSQCASWFMFFEISPWSHMWERDYLATSPLALNLNALDSHVHLFNSPLSLFSLSLSHLSP